MIDLLNPFDPLGLKDEEEDKWSPTPKTTKSVVFKAPSRQPGATPITSVKVWRESQAQRKEEKKAAKKVESVVFNETSRAEARATQVKALHPTSDIWAPSSKFKERAEAIRKEKAAARHDPDAPRNKSDLAEFYALQRKLGASALSSRMANIKDMWDIYGDGIGQEAVVWAFTKSKFTEDEIRGMMETAQSKWKSIGATPITAHIQDKLKASDDLGVQQALQAVYDYRYASEDVEGKSEKGMQAALSLAAIPASGPAIAGLAAKAGMAANLAGKALKVGRLIEIIPSVQMGFTAAVTAVEEKNLGTITKKVNTIEAQVENVANPLGPKKSGLDYVPGYESEMSKPFQELADIRDFVGSLTEVTDRDQVKRVEEYWKSIGIPVEPDGVIDFEDRSAVMEAAKAKLYRNIDLQRAAMESGDAPYWAPVNGDLESSEWSKWMTNYETRINLEEAAAASNPAKAAWYDMSGWPRNQYEAKALWNEITSQGKLQALYASPLKLAELAGNTYNATLSARNLRAREDTDKTYQALVNDLTEFMAENPSDEGADIDAKAEAMLWCGDYSLLEAEARIEQGDLKDDEEAQKLWGAVKQYQAKLIDERYAPDMLLTAGYMLGFDPDDVKQVGLDHPDLVRAVDVAADITIGLANPLGRLKRMYLKPSVKPGKPSNFLRSGRAMEFSNRAADYAYSGVSGIGRASSYLKGRAAGDTVTDLWRYVGKKNPKLDYRSGLVQQIATKVADGIQSGDAAAINRALKDTDADFIDSVIARVDGVDASWKDTTNMSAVARASRAATKKKVVDTVSRQLAKRQTEVGDVVSKESFRKAMAVHLADTYAKGVDIMPYLRDSKLAPPNRLLQSAVEHTAGIKNQWCREFVTKFTVGQITRAPTVETEFFSPESLDRAFDAAMVVSQDAAWASVFRGHWASSRTTGQFKRLVEELDAKFNEKFYTAPQQIKGVMESLSYYRNRGPEDAGMALAPDPTITPETISKKGLADVVDRGKPPRLLTQYKTIEGELKQAVPDTVYQKAFAQMHRSAMWAPYRIPDNAGLLSTGILTTKNLAYRLPINLAHRASTPLRQLSVVMGAGMLFQKHALADTTRTTLEYGPHVIMEAMGLKAVTVKGRELVPKVRSYLDAEYEKALSEVDATVADVVKGDNERGHWSEAQYNSGKYRRRFRPKSIRDGEGNIINLEESSQALRRITQGKAFKAWCAGQAKVADNGTSMSRYARQQAGYHSLEKWLNSKEGRLFLRESNWYDKTTNIMQEKGEAIKGRQKEIHAATVQEYMETMVDREWSRLDSQMPVIMDEMKRMALNEQSMSAETIGRLIEANPRENAVVSTKAMEFQGQGMLGYITGKAMYMNKWNREVVFKKEFTSQYKALVKDGVDPNNAALSASTIALNNVSRVHFDLANALTVEARHRWAAWFATKHRLYATFMGKLALERPMLAGAATEISAWMEERNERDGQTGFDKGDLIFSVLGKEFRVNLAPYLWLTDYPLESSLLSLIEGEASSLVNEVVGADWLHPAPTPFGHSVFRGDALIKTVLDARSYRDNVKDDESLSAWLANMSTEDEARWNKLINMKRAEFLARGEEVTPLEASRMVIFGAVKSEAWKAFRPFSGTMKGKESLHIEKLLQQFTDLAETDPDAASDLLNKEPELAACLNSTMNPIEKAQLDEGWRVFNQLQDDFQRKIEAEYEAGTLIENYDELMDEYRSCRDRMLNAKYDTYNPAFATVFGGSNTEELLEAVGFVTPIISPDSIVRTGLEWTDDEKSKERAKLDAEVLIPALAEYGMTEDQPDGSTVVAANAKSSVLYQILKQELVDTPLAKKAGYEESPLYTYDANSVARYLAKGGKPGVYRKDQFLELVKSRKRREIVGAKISDGQGAKSNPWLATMSDAEADLLGLTRNPESKQQWKEWALGQWAIRKYQRENKISPTSKLGKQQWQAFEDQSAQRAAANPDWGYEWQLSRVSMADRLNMFGIGEGTDAESRSWGEFIGVVSDYMYELKNTYNKTTKKNGIGPRSQTVGKEIVEKYIPKVAAIAKANPDWWKAFQDNFTMSKFGFYWHSSDPANNFIFGSATGPIASEGDDSEWYTIWEEEAGLY